MAMAHRILGTLLVILTVLPCIAATTNNDDSCDIAVLPAATLLLPYFDVDIDNPLGETTVFTITNVGNLDRIAHVTLWTDRAYPVFGFDIYLTGYDVQAIDLYDVIERGVIAPDAGTGTMFSKRQKYSDRNPALDYSHCERLPGALDDPIIQRLWDALIYGRVDGCIDIGGDHSDHDDHAIGYATIDVVGSCGSAGVTDDDYWTKDIRYDNFLTGDYAQINRQENLAQAEPLVHIRAIPEGGTPMRRRAFPDEFDAGFERTFYGRYQPKDAPKLDGRQPLPSQFAARWINGGSSAFETRFKIWREGRDVASCANTLNKDLAVNDIVVFDEDENVVGTSEESTLPATSNTNVADASVFPPLPGGTSSGWVYFDLDGRTSQLARPRQGWLISSMRAEGRVSTDTTAVAMGNGCSTRVHNAEIGPAPKDDSCDVGLYPAATLLLPYFQVDLEARYGEATLFSITNVSGTDHIARVTLWTDYAFPVLSFNVFLGAYDVQSINLYDVIASGLLPNDSGGCTQQVHQLPEDFVGRLQSAFTEGTVPTVGTLVGCNNVGNVHDDAVGYATIDVVRNCSTNLPTSPAYWTDDVAYDNVLIGDRIQLHTGYNLAQGSPLVHIRAVPENVSNDAGFAHTFYASYQSSTAPKRDRRQPLPSRFAARWIEGGSQALHTLLDIWREPKRGSDAICSTWDDNVQTVAEMAVFDDAENGVGFVRGYYELSQYFPFELMLPATSRTSVRDSSVYPQLTNGAVAGWVYVNLDDLDPSTTTGRNSWVVVSKYDEGRYGVSLDATGMGNGCSPIGDLSEIGDGDAVINPSP
jgi:hypothetical protein